MGGALFLKGIVVGCSIAAPVGPIGLLCIGRTLDRGFRAGFMTGLGAAVADGLYGMIAGVGIAGATTFIGGAGPWLRAVGGTALVAIGIGIALKSTSKTRVAIQGGGAWDFGSAFALTLTNPMTIAAFAAVIAALGLGDTPAPGFSIAIFMGGVFMGSALWWFLLSVGVSRFRTVLRPAHVRAIHFIAGGIVCAFGAAALVRLVA